MRNTEHEFSFCEGCGAPVVWGELYGRPHPFGLPFPDSAPWMLGDSHFNYCGDIDKLQDSLQSQGIRTTNRRSRNFKSWLAESERGNAGHEVLPIEHLSFAEDEDQLPKRLKELPIEEQWLEWQSFNASKREQDAAAERLATFLCKAGGPFPRRHYVNCIVSAISHELSGPLRREDGTIHGFVLWNTIFNEIHAHLHDGMRMSLSAEQPEHKPVQVLGFQLEPFSPFFGFIIGQI